MESRIKNVSKFYLGCSTLRKIVRENFGDYKPIIKGDYNGAFDDHETLPGVVIIHSEDYWRWGAVSKNITQSLAAEIY